jgi:hypothetical protein
MASFKIEDPGARLNINGQRWLAIHRKPRVTTHELHFGYYRRFSTSESRVASQQAQTTSHNM